MAELDTSSHDSGKKGPGVKKGKKLSTRVDLTPMVDLGFLLITFFMFTTTMSQPNAMNLKMPDDKQNVDPTKIKQSGALTIFLGKDNHIYYYEGENLKADLSNVQSSNFKDIRKVILDKKANTPPDDLFVVVMPGNASTYKNIIDILDEFSIDMVERYALVNKVDPQYEADISKLDSLSTQ
ncbi:MAG TPA: biopolymer transporter ExbD [Arachidicoccus soli]|uniref:Biopolymer transporter ExbD n=1 Tax=Arachidicoccus soli TaxID=2341117 RepID=A0A386HT08_9BACT|nr:biopolymer transporter ExbD [Arachidicoccus soli]AYD48799.1 biopolymer transporter ExbD [Arachidicoccus soli]HEU0228776.1 biopolymer transporter ExbD [Arachidicoccus soli]